MTIGTVGLFLPITEQAYIKSTPQKGANPAKSVDDQVGQLAKALFPEFDASKFLIDCLHSEEPTYDNVVPQNPLEDGSFTTDHIANLPDALVLDFLISDTPIDKIDPLKGRIDSSKGRSRDEYDRLKELRLQNEPMTIVTGLDVYTNMVITSFVPKKDNSGYKIEVRMAFQEIQVVKSSTAPASTFEEGADEEIEHSINAGQAIGVTFLAAVHLGVI